MKIWSRGAAFDVPWNMLYWCSMKSITLKINEQTFEYEIKVQALKDTSWMKPHYLAIDFFVLKVSNSHSCSVLIEGFYFA